MAIVRGKRHKLSTGISAHREEGEAPGAAHRPRAAAHAKLLCAACVSQGRQSAAQGAQIEPIDDPVAICEVINDAAAAYRGVIPADRWHEPYMTLADLRAEI